MAYNLHVLQGLKHTMEVSLVPDVRTHLLNPLLI
jgi:hypothetical protein